MHKKAHHHIDFENAPTKVREIVFALRDGLNDTLREKLLGLYLYGSLAYGCFNPETSDIDFMVVLSVPLTSEEEQKIAELHERLGRDPEYGKRLEGTYMTEVQVKVESSSPEFLYYVDGKEFVKAKEGQGEPDFPMHRQHLYEEGIKVVGYEPRKFFLPVRWEILEPSLRQELPFIREQFNDNPVYAVLNLCRVVRAYETRKLSSKKQGGEWGLQNLPSRFHKMIQAALEVYIYRQTDEQNELLAKHLTDFYQYCMQRISVID